MGPWLRGLQFVAVQHHRQLPPISLLGAIVQMIHDAKMQIACNHILFLDKNTNMMYGSGHGTAAVLLPGFAINW